MGKVKKIVWQWLNHIHMGGAVQLMLQSALTENGWFRSFHTKRSVDKDGNPIPWCTYPFIHFIEPRLNKHIDVFEFGCGNSTIWYARHVKSIKAVEHDESWVKIVKPKLPSNAYVVYRNLEGSEYAEEVKADGKKYHIIIIDGRQRKRSAASSVERLTQDGIIIWDNSDREQYQPMIQQLLESGFRRLDFWGMSPVASHLTCTTIFYRQENCLHI